MLKKNVKKFRNPYTKALLIILGLLSVTLGVIGIFLPILPTTPFFLLAAFFFTRSSQKLYRWLLTNRFLGSYIRNYIQYKAISPVIKTFTLVLLWGTIFYSIFILQGKLWLQILLGVIAISVSVHVIRLRSMSKGIEDEVGDKTECGAKDKL